MKNKLNIRLLAILLLAGIGVSCKYTAGGGNINSNDNSANANKPASTETPLDPWSVTAKDNRGQNGKEFHYDCPPNGKTSRGIYGTDIYTDDSTVCGAAVHTGLITFESGGRVVIEIRPGQPAYKGSKRNGITSLDFGEWGGSFVIVRRGEVLL